MTKKSLILVFLPAVPQVSIKGKEHKTYKKNSADLMQMGRDDVKSIKHQKFGTFNDAYVCDDLIYLGKDDQKNSLAQTLKNLIDSEVISSQLDNLAINFSGHGMIDVIGGGKGDYDERLDVGPKTLANRVLAYVIQGFKSAGVKMPTNGLDFYIRACNSGHPNSQDFVDNDEALTDIFVQNSFAGIFALRLRKLMQDEKLDFPVRVSGFIGLLKASHKTPYVEVDGKDFLASDSRVVFGSNSPFENLSITFPNKKDLYTTFSVGRLRDDDELSNFSIDEDYLSAKKIIGKAFYGDEEVKGSNDLMMAVKTVMKYHEDSEKLEDITGLFGEVFTSYMLTYTVLLTMKQKGLEFKEDEQSGEFAHEATLKELQDKIIATHQEAEDSVAHMFTKPTSAKKLQSSSSKDKAK